LFRAHIGAIWLPTCSFMAGGIVRGASIGRVLAVVIVLGAMALAPIRVHSDSEETIQAEAGCLVNFPRFIEWPSGSFQSPAAPFVIGIVGRNPFGLDLARLAWEASARGRAIEVRQFRLGDDLHACQILFIGWPNQKIVMQILTSLEGSSVLTVSDASGFVNWGGMIEFTHQGEKVRFAVNDQVVKRAGIKASSNLLKLASQVIESAGAGTN
jgi:YfiR/HmsC-like